MLSCSTGSRPLPEMRVIVDSSTGHPATALPGDIAGQPGASPASAGPPQGGVRGLNSSARLPCKSWSRPAQVLRVLPGGPNGGVSPLPEPAYARCHGLAGPPLHLLPRRERPLPGVLLLRSPRPRPGGHVACVLGTGPCREDRLPSRQTGRPAPGGPRRGPLPLPGPRRHVVRPGPGDASRGPTERLAREPPALRLCPLRPTDPRRRQLSASRLGKPPAPRRRRTPPPHPRPDLLAPSVRPVTGAP